MQGVMYSRWYYCVKAGKSLGIYGLYIIVFCSWDVGLFVLSLSMGITCMLAIHL